jgi:hypothetical protein
MKRNLLTPILALGLILCLMAPTANAWEFTMDGTFTWSYEVRGQTGSNGFFGSYDVDAGANEGAVGTYAPLNFWTGLRMTDGQIRPAANAQDLVSGSDAGVNSMYMSTNMQIRMNPAVRIRGNYYIGSWDHRNWLSAGDAGVLTNQVAAALLVSPEYLNMHAHGVQRSFSPGYWRTLWLSAQLPWGEIAVGKRPASWGMGLTFDGASNRASESLALAAPFGPLRVQLGFYPSRRAHASQYFNNSYDKNNSRVFDWSANVTYANGPMSAGVVANFVQAHSGGEGVLNTSALRTSPATSGNPALRRGVYNDLSEWYGNAFFKYNNGRFFLNSEVATYQANRSFLANNTYAAGFGARMNTTNGVWMDNVNAPTIHNFWAGAIEAGALCGPAKIAVLASWLTGNDTRVDPNTDIRRLVEVGVQPDTFSNTSVFRPYSYLMAYSYSMGNTRGATDSRDGWVSDASVYAARLDYAVAANLNLFTSFMWAERFSKSGYTWGFVYPTPTVTTGGWTNMANSTVAGAPSIPDTALGWEIDGGADWKLLEGLTVRTTVAYWQPGKWFAYAMQDKSVPGWGTSTANGSWANNWLTRPGKTIDPIWGLDIKLEGTF